MKPSKTKHGKTGGRHVPATPTRAASVSPPHSSAGRRLWPYFVGLAIAFFAVFAVYGPVLNGPFLLDDSYLPYDQAVFAKAPLTAWLRGVRPLLMFTYWWNFHESGPNTEPYHLFNVVLHVLNGGFIFLAIRRLLKWVNVDNPRRELLAAFAAGLFLLHPLQTESVSYIASRSETLSVFCFLAAYVVFLYRRTVQIDWLASLAILILFGAACLTKEHAVVLPALLLLTDYFFNPGFSLSGIRGNWRLYLPMAAGAVLAIAFVWSVLSASTSAGFGVKGLTWYAYFFTECRAIWMYFLFYVFPFGQNLDHTFPISNSPLDHGAGLALLALIACVTAAWIFRKRYPLISFGLLTALLLFAPTSSFVPIADPLVERRMYLPFIGLTVITVGLLRLAKLRPGTLAMILGGVLLVEGAFAYSRNQLWGNAVDIWQDSVRHSPRKPRPNFQLAYALYDAGRCSEAVTQYGNTAALEAPAYDLLIDWALAYDCAGDNGKALEKLKQSAALSDTAHVHTQIAMEYAKQGKYPEALAELDKAQRVDGNFEITYLYRGNIFSLQGQRARAAAEYRRALELNPDDALARDGLARTGA